MNQRFIYVVATLLSAVVPLVVGQNATFQGPGYLACPIIEGVDPCSDFDVDPTCTIDQITACNLTDVIPTTSADFTTVYVPLICECAIFSGCQNSCEKFTGDQPTLPPIGFTSNFTGVGSVTCPTADWVRAATMGQCQPGIVNDDETLCGNCDLDFSEPDDDFSGALFTIPLLCECFTLNNCPDTCTYEKGNVTITSPTDIGTTPAPATTTVPPPSAAPATTTVPPPSAAPATATVTPPSAPVVGSSAPTATPAKESSPSTAPVSAPIAKTPVSLPTAPVPTNSTTGGSGTSSAKPYDASSVAMMMTALVIMLSPVVSLLQ